MPWFCRNRPSQWCSWVFDVRELMVPLHYDTRTHEIARNYVVEKTLSLQQYCIGCVRKSMVPLCDDTHTCEISVRSAVETMLSRWLPCIEDMRKSMVPPHFHTFTIEIA